MDLIEVDFNLPELLQDLQSMFNLKCKEKGITLVTDYQDPLPGAVVGDPNKLRQILINLMGNAIKFTTTGSVTLRLRHAGTYDLVFEVQDTGPGIPQDSLEAIFMPFQQVKGKYQEGTGLGLAISRKLTELMGGTIHVTSELGQGSTFRVAIPLRASTAVFSGSRQHPKQISGLSSKNTFRILVVDDVPPNREVARVMLEAIGFEVMEAENGQIAVDAYQEKPFDLILMDIIMPVLDGIGAMMAIRALPNGKDVPIIALTASGFEGKNVELKRQGFTEYVRKPFYEPDLLELIGKLIGAEYEYEELEPNPESKDVGVDDIVAYLRTFSEPSQLRINEAMEEQDFDAILSVLRAEEPSEANQAVVDLFTSILERADYFQLTQVAKRYQDV
jgi:CheY-like chemotaxis protein